LGNLGTFWIPKCSIRNCGLVDLSRQTLGSPIVRSYLDPYVSSWLGFRKYIPGTNLQFWTGIMTYMYHKFKLNRSIFPCVEHMEFACPKEFFESNVHFVGRVLLFLGFLGSGEGSPV